MTEEQKRQRQKNKRLAIVFAVCFALCITLRLFVNSGFLVLFVLAGMLLFPILSIFNLVKMLIQTPEYYRKKNEKNKQISDQRVRQFYSTHTKEISIIKEYVNKVEMALLSKGIPLSNVYEDYKLGVLKIGVFADYDYLKEDGATYKIIVSRYVNQIIVSHLDLYRVACWINALWLIEHNDDYSAFASDCINDFREDMEGFYHKFNKKRSGGYFEINRKDDVRVLTGDYDRISICVKTALGIDYVDVYALNRETYDKLAELVS